MEFSAIRRYLSFAVILSLVVPFAVIAGKSEYEPVICGKKPPHTIILTFDDGPRTKITPQILDFLKEEKIRATFFVLGQNINPSAARNKEEREEMEGNRALLLRAKSEGHEIANHTYGHPLISEWLPKKGKQWILNDIERNARLIHDLLGYRPRFFRPRSWVIDIKFPTKWVVSNTFPNTLCGEYHAEQVLPPVEHVKYPDNKLFAEELTCQGYIVQVQDDREMFRKLRDEHLRDRGWLAFRRREPRVVERILRERAARIREVQDVDTEDWKQNALFAKNPDEAVAKLTQHIRAYLAARENEGIFTHILTFHELEFSLAALKVLMPQWKAAGYRFKSLHWAWGI